MWTFSRAAACKAVSCFSLCLVWRVNLAWEDIHKIYCGCCKATIPRLLASCMSNFISWEGQRTNEHFVSELCWCFALTGKQTGYLPPQARMYILLYPKMTYHIPKERLILFLITTIYELQYTLDGAEKKKASIFSLHSHYCYTFHGPSPYFLFSSGPRDQDFSTLKPSSSNTSRLWSLRGTDTDSLLFCLKHYPLRFHIRMASAVYLILWGRLELVFTNSILV